MKRIICNTWVILVFLLSVRYTTAAETGWDDKLANVFSGRLKEIDRELDEAAAKLDALPEIPIDDQGGTGGYAAVYTKAEPEADSPHAMEVRWKKPARVDLVALVPSRRYDAKGLDSQYGMPDAFTVELIDAAGKTVSVVAREHGTRANPVRKGHPFVYQVVPAVEAAGLRVRADLIQAEPENAREFVHAWSEWFVFEGDRNVAFGGEVGILGGAGPSAPWHWKPAFLVDGQTPLGLPELPKKDHQNIGWLSNGRDNERETVTLFIDFGESVRMDGVRLVPARRPTSDLPSGFGFPRKLVISVSDVAPGASGGDWHAAGVHDMPNPGHNPLFMPMEAVKGRYLRIEATRLWKVFEDYPAFMALSELEVFDGGRNIALNRPVQSPDGMLNLIASGGRYWSSAALSDGFGPDGLLVATREWLGMLDQRLQLETRRHGLNGESTRIVRGWHDAALAACVLLGLAGAVVAVFLPIRFRIHARRELERVRDRIAGDLHDEVGSNLGSIQMFVDLAEGRTGPSDELKRIQRIAAETVSAVRDIVWLLRPGGDHRIATVEHLRETGSIMLEGLQWKFSANDAAWGVELSEEANRELFLFFREALHNISRHARAKKAEVRVDQSESGLCLVISDDGVGIDPAKLERPATLRALRQRAQALDADLQVDSEVGQGTKLVLRIPLVRKHLAKSRRGKPAPGNS